jgi:hypothetical protein
MRDFIKHFLQEQTEIIKIISGKNVKGVIVTSFPPGTSKEFLHSEFHFDQAGNKIEYKRHKAGRIITWEKFVYDDENKLIEILDGQIRGKSGGYQEKDFQFISKLPVNPKFEEFQERNEEDQNISLTFYAPDKIKSKRTFNADGICTQVYEFSLNGAVTNKELYDNRGQLLEARRYRKDGSPLNYTENTYNDKSQLCRSISISRTDHKTHDTVIRYNKEGLMEDFIDYPDDPNNAFADLKGASGGFSHKYTYQPNGLLEMDNLYLCGELIMTYKYSYQFR